MSSLTKIFVSLLVLCIVFQCKCETQVFKNELSDEAKTVAIGIAEREILLKYSDSVVAQTLSNDFSRIYGGKWTSYVGLRSYIEGIIPSINAAPNTTLWFAYNTTNVLLFKSNQCESHSTYKEVVVSALSFNITYTDAENDVNSTGPAILAVIKESLALYNIECTSVAPSNWADSRNCYYKIASYIQDALSEKYAYNWVVIVGKLNSGAIRNPNYKFAYEVVFNSVIDFTIFSI